MHMNADPLLNSTIDNRYVIEGHIGSGGAGDVYRARDLVLSRVVAIKFVKLSSGVAFKRFERERNALSEIHCSKLPEVYSWGRYQSDTVFIVLEFVEGQTLEQFAQNQRLAVEQVSSIAIQICEGLTAIHEKGVIHRDLKPSNIMVSQDGQQLDAKILDLGVAHLLEEDEALTQSDAVLGSHGYLSPEHLTPSRLDARSDIFSLGCVLYRLFAGRTPCESDSVLATILKLKEGDFDELPSSVPAYFQSIVYKCLAPEPKDRFQSADELKASLLRQTTAVVPLKFAGKARRSKKHANRIVVISVVTVIVLGVIYYANSERQGPVSQPELALTQTFDVRRLEITSLSSADMARLLEQLHTQDERWWTRHKRREKRERLLKGLSARAAQFYSLRDRVTGEKIFEAAHFAHQRLGTDQAEQGRTLIDELEAKCWYDESQFQKVSADVLENLLKRLEEPCDRQRVYIMAAHLALQRNDLPKIRSAIYHAVSEASPDAVDVDSQERELQGIVRIQQLASAAGVHSESDSCRLLQSRMKTLRSFLGDKRTPPQTQTAVLFFSKCARLPYKSRGAKWTTELNKLLDEAIRSESRKDWNVCFKLLQDLLACETAPGHRQVVIDDIENLSNMRISEELLAELVVLINTKIRLPDSTVLRFLAKPGWLAVSNRLLDCYNNGTKEDLASLQTLFHSLKESPGTVHLLRPTVGMRLALCLLKNKEPIKSAEVVRTLLNTGVYSDGGFVSPLGAMASLSAEQIPNLELLFDKLRKEPLKSKAQIVDSGTSLALLLAKQKKREEARTVLTLLNTYELTPANYIELLPVYAAVGNTTEFEHALEKVLFLAKTDNVLRRKALCQAVMFWSRKQDSSEKVYKVVGELEQLPGWITEEAIATLCTFYFGLRDIKSTLALAGSVERQTDLSQQQRSRLEAMIAITLADMGARNEADKVIDLVKRNKNYVNDTQTVLKLCDIYEHRNDVHSLVALFREIPKTPETIATRLEIELRAAYQLAFANLDSKVESMLAEVASSPEFKDSTALMERFLQVCTLRQDVAGLLKVAALCQSRSSAPSERAHLLCTTARRLADLGQFKQGRKYADEIRINFPWDKAPAVASALMDFYLVEANISALQSMLESGKCNQEQRLTCESYLATVVAQSGDEARAKSLVAKVRPLVNWSQRTMVTDAVLECYELLGDIEALKQIMREKNCSPSISIRLLGSLASLYGASGRTSDVDAAISQLVQFEKESSCSQLQLQGHIYFARKQTTKLRELYERTRKTCPKCPSVGYLLALCLNSESRFSDANQIISGIVAHKEGAAFRDLALDLAVVYYDAHDWKRLQNLYDGLSPESCAITKRRMAPRLACGLDLLNRQCEADAVIAELKKDPNWNSNPVTLELLSKVYQRRKDLKNLLLLARASENSSRVLSCKSVVQARLAGLYHTLGQESEADKTITKLLSNPSTLKRSEDALSLLADIFEERKNKEMLAKVLGMTQRTLYPLAACRRAEIALKLAKLWSEDPVKAKTILLEVVSELAPFTSIHAPAKSLTEKAKASLTQLDRTYK
jgi:hypothetical protein